MEIVVYSHRHHLTPYYFRLVNQGSPAYLLVHKQPYESALSGKVTPALRGENHELNPETLKVIQDQVASGEAVLLTDLKKHQFVGGRILGVREFIPPKGILRLGAWFDGHGFLAHHLLICDEGMWPGGLGPQRLGGLTMVLPREPLSDGPVHSLLAPVAESLQGFVGLVQVGIDLDPETGGFKAAGTIAGWPWLHSAAFISELENFPAVCYGTEAPVFTRGKRFVTVVPVSIPPYPNPGRAPKVKLEGLTPQYAAKWFWMDARVEGNQLWSAGLDGMLGIARGAAGTPELARATAVTLAGTLGVPEKQFRTDTGALVPTVLAQLEQSLGFVV
jgi:hypothetical protein